MATPVRLGSGVVSSWTRGVGLTCAGASFCEGVLAGGAETVRLRLGRTVVPAGPVGAAALIGPAGPVEAAEFVGVAGISGNAGVAGMAALVGMVGKLALVGLVGAVLVVRGAPDLPMSHCKAASSRPCERANTSKL